LEYSILTLLTFKKEKKANQTSNLLWINQKAERFKKTLIFLKETDFSPKMDEDKQYRKVHHSLSNRKSTNLVTKWLRDTEIKCFNK
jgi:hypothetical protein